MWGQSLSVQLQSCAVWVAGSGLRDGAGAPPPVVIDGALGVCPQGVLTQ